MGEKPDYRSIAAGIVRRGLVGAGAGALVLGAVQIATPGSAAATSGLTRTTATSATNSVNKSHTVMCAAGKKVLGGAGRIDGAPLGEVGLTTATVVGNGAGFKVSAAEDANGTTANWSVTAIAFCATPPQGLQYVSFTFASGSTKSRWSSITCPKGKKILGAGATVNGGNNRVLLTGLVPSEDARTVTGTAYEDEVGTPNNWSVTATATCVKPVQGQEIVQAATAQSSDVSIASATLTCPDGTKLHGVGGEVVGGNGEVRMRQLDGSPTSQAQVRAAEDATGYGNPWSVRTFGICAK
jgi:hypothetical protein